MFGIYLWKEWREQRRLFALWAVLVPLTHLAGWTLLEPAGWWVHRDPLGVLLPTAITLLITVFLFSFDLISKEKERGNLLLLCRLPGDLKQVFWAKTLLLFVILLLSGMVGLLSLCLVSLESVEVSIPPSDPYVFLGILVLMSLALGFWGFATSCWLPNGSMALPLTLILAGAAWFPYILMWMPSWVSPYLFKGERELWGYRIPQPYDLEWAVLLILFLPVVSILGAWLSFIAFRKGGS